MAMRIKNIPVGTIGNAAIKGRIIYADIERVHNAVRVIFKDSRDAADLSHQYPQPSWRLVNMPKGVAWERRDND